MQLLRVKFDIVDGFIRVCNITRHLVLFSPEKYEAIYNRIRYVMSQKNDITYVITHNYTKSKLIHMILCLQKKY